MSTERARRDYADFVCDLGDMKNVHRILEREGVEIPEKWTPDPEGFVVTEDGGRVMTIKFWDFETDKPIGDGFEIDFDDARSYWA
jgi:hypothetical protein